MGRRRPHGRGAFTRRQARVLWKLAAGRRAGRAAAQLRHGLSAVVPAGKRLLLLGMAHFVSHQRRAGRDRPLYPIEDHGNAGTGLQQAQKIAHVPFFELIRTHGWNTLLGLGARYIEGVTFNMFGVFIIAYVSGVLQLPRQTALAGVMISSALMIIMLPVYGNLSDHIGRRRMFAVAGLLIGILSFPAFWLMETKSPILIWLAITVPFAFVYPAVYGPQAALFSELFDTRVRYTGISFVYQFSGIFASGLTPIIATSLLPLGGNKPWLICGYILVVSMISAASVFAMRDMHKRDMTADNVVPGLKPAKQA